MALIAAASVCHLVIGPTLSLPTGRSAAHQCRRNAYDCSHFRARIQAQAAYLALRWPRKDVHGLDQDRDGERLLLIPRMRGAAW